MIRPSAFTLVALGFTLLECVWLPQMSAYAVSASDPVPAPSPDAKGLLMAATQWGCQFQKLDIALAQASPLDLIVIDPDAADNHGRVLDAADVTTLKAKPGGQRRLVFSYLSVGEAESYRRYWKRGWRGEAPDWLGPENPNWPGSFTVRFWDDGWQRLLLGSPEAALDRILKLGFDGVFLDRVDAYSDWADRPAAAQDMVQLVSRISRYAHERKHDFLVIAQNSENLLGDASYLAAIDAVSKESLLYGVNEPGQPNTADQVSWSLTKLMGAKRRGLPIFAIEYLDDPRAVEAARGKLHEFGFVPFFATRLLDRLP